EGSAIGLQLGCNGIIHILFEYVDLQQANHPITLLECVLKQRAEILLITCFSTQRLSEQRGTILVIDSYGDKKSTSDPLLSKLADHIVLATANRQSVLTAVQLDGKHCEAFIEYLPPNIQLIIAGAGNDVQPLVDTAKLLGWEV